MAVHLEQDVCAHSFAMSDYGLLVLSFSIPAIQLHTSGRKESTRDAKSRTSGIKSRSTTRCLQKKLKCTELFWEGLLLLTTEALIPAARQQHLTVHLH